MLCAVVGVLGISLPPSDGVDARNGALGGRVCMGMGGARGVVVGCGVRWPQLCKGPDTFPNGQGINCCELSGARRWTTAFKY